MIKQDFDQLLSGVVKAVLETMFFTTPLVPCEPETSNNALEARLNFHGFPSGTLSVRLSEASARTLGAGFLGKDEEALEDIQVRQVVCELSNMLCGSLVSKLESDRRFDLDSPELIPFESNDVNGPEAPLVTQQSFGIENGILTVTLHLGVVA